VATPAALPGAYLVGPGGERDRGAPHGGAPRAGGQFRLRHSEPFRCAYRVYEGPPEGLAQSWRAFARELRDTGHALSGEQRLLFPTAPASGNVRIEMQLGVEG